jgi:hypothetical protein
MVDSTNMDTPAVKTHHKIGEDSCHDTPGLLSMLNFKLVETLITILSVFKLTEALNILISLKALQVDRSSNCENNPNDDSG